MMILDSWQKEILESRGNIVLCSGRQVGKSTIISYKSSEFAVKNNNKSVLIISSTERQASELFLKCLNYCEANYKGMIMRGKDRPTTHTLKLKNGSVIRSLPTGLAGTGIRGFTVDMLIADEAAFIPDLVFQACTPMLLTTGGDIILVSTPHGRVGYFWSAYNDPSFKVFHVNSEEVITKREISVTWSMEQRIKALAHLEGEKLRMTQLQYAQEYLGAFVEELRQFFPDDLIRKCMTQKRGAPIRKGIRSYFLGIDVSRLGEDQTAYEILDRTDREHLIQVENIVQTKKRLNETFDKIIQLDRQYGFKQIYIDDGGIGCSVFDWLLATPQTSRKIVAINNRARPLDRDEEHKKKLLKEDLYNNLLMLMEQSRIEFLDDDEIFLSLKSVQYEYVVITGAHTKLRIFGNFTHIAEGLIRAAWCIKDKHLNIWVR